MAAAADSRSLPRRASSWYGRALVLLAAVLWSTSALFAKAPIFDQWPIQWRGTALAFWRAAFAAVVLMLAVRHVQWSWYLVPMVAVFAAMNWAYLNALVYAEASVAIWLQYTAPIWVFLGGAIFLRESVTWRDWVLFAFTLVGVGIIVGYQLRYTSGQGVAYGLASGFFFGGVVLMLRRLRHFDAIWLVLMNHAVTALLFLPAVLHSGLMPQGAQWLFLIGFGVLQMGLPYVLFAHGVRHVSSHEAAAISLLEPILLPLWVFLVWSQAPGYQPPHWTTLLGGGILLTGLGWRYAVAARREARQWPGTGSKVETHSPPGNKPLAKTRLGE